MATGGEITRISEVTFLGIYLILSIKIHTDIQDIYTTVVLWRCVYVCEPKKKKV